MMRCPPWNEKPIKCFLGKTSSCCRLEKSLFFIQRVLPAPQKYMFANIPGYRIIELLRYVWTYMSNLREEERKK